MDNFSSMSSITIGELCNIVKDFEAKFEKGTDDPERFLTLAEIEALWGRLIEDTNSIYSDMVHRLVNSIDEKSIVCKKNRIPRQRDTIKESQKGY